MTYEGFKKVGPEEWKRNIEHVRSKVDHCWEEDNLQEEYIEQFIIHFGEESDESLDEEDTSSDTDLQCERQ